MGKVTKDRLTEPIKTRRVEIVDAKGRVRIVLGYLGEGDGEVFGIVVRDSKGRDRAAMLHDGPAAEVALDFAGNTVAALTVAADGRAELIVSD